MKFDSYHPAINIIFFASVIAFALLFSQPVFLVIGYFCAFVYSSYLGKMKAVVRNLIIFILVLIYTAYYSAYNHLGITILANNWIGNSITLESVCYGFVRGIQLATAAMWFYCMTQIVSSDKVIYLLGKIWPRLSLFVSVFLRFLPQVAVRFSRINSAQTALGKGITQGSILKRVKHLVRTLSILVTQILESFVDSASSMKSRGYSLKGRTAFSIYRFDNRDRLVVITMFFCLTVMIMGMMLDQTKMLSNPEIFVYPITSFSYVFYMFYLLFCLMPLFLQWVTQWRSSLGIKRVF